ncbi:MAG: PAS domain S-box protein, partial [Bacillota bacterium]
MEQQNISIIEERGNIRRIDFKRHNYLTSGVAMNEFDLLKKIIDISRDGIVVFNKSYNLVYINLSFVKMSGYNMMELKGLSVKEFGDRFFPHQSIRIPFDVYALGNEDPFTDFKYILKKKNAETAFVQLSLCRVLEMQDITNPGCAMIIREINSLIESQEWRAKANFLTQNSKV